VALKVILDIKTRRE